MTGLYKFTFMISKFLLTASSLTCYQGTGDNIVPVYAPKICEDNEVCTKTQIFGQDTVRDCGTGVEGCIESEMIKTTRCACSSNLCNTSFAIKGSMIVQLLALTVAVTVVPNIRI